MFLNKGFACAVVLGLVAGCTLDESGPLGHAASGKGGSSGAVSNGSGGTTAPAGGATPGSSGVDVGTAGTLSGSAEEVAEAGDNTADSGVIPVDEPPPSVCYPSTPSDPLIADFHQTGQTTGISFGDYAGGLSGYSYQYGAGLVSDVSTGVWHLSGMVSEYSGFGLGFNYDNSHNVDASAYSGVSFTIKGNVGPSNTVTLGVQNGPDSSGSSTFSACATCNAGCADPSKTFSVTPGGATVSLKWSDFTGGQPHPGVDPKQLLGFIWYFSWTGPGSTPYAVDITVDDVKLLGGGNGDAAAD
jgi:hypothetical protein